MPAKYLSGKTVLITAGPTREAIDPVRYISNHSSGKMGYAIAGEFLKQGASVILVSGPVCLDLHHPELTLVKVVSADDMNKACSRYFEQADIVVFAAAVADYRPARPAAQKIKKTDDALRIELVKNADIAARFGKIKTASQLAVGFALETENEMTHAIGKLRRKNFDLVVLNSMNDPQATFGHDTNKITIVRKDLSSTVYPLKNKRAVAEDIVHEIGNAMTLLELGERNRLALEYEMMYR